MEGGPNTPAVFRNTVYVTSHGKETLYALNTTSGEAFWTFKTGRSKAPVVANRIVYVSAGIGSDNVVYALNALTGNEQWSFRPERGPSRVAVADGTVYFTGGKFDHRAVWAVDAQDGTLDWKTSIPGGGHAMPPTVANGVVFVSTAHEGVYALDADKGTKLWQRKFADSRGTRSPAVAGDTVYIGTRHRMVYAVEATTGNTRWSASLKGRPSSPAVVNGIAYTAHNRFITALNAQTGSKIATFSPTNPNRRTASGLAVLNGSLYIAYGVPGDHGGYDDTTVNALGSPKITYSDLSVSSQAVRVNESVTLTTTVENTGTGPGSYDASLTINDRVASKKSGTL